MRVLEFRRARPNASAAEIPGTCRALRCAALSPARATGYAASRAGLTRRTRRAFPDSRLSAGRLCAFLDYLRRRTIRAGDFVESGRAAAFSDERFYSRGIPFRRVHV